MKILLKAFIQLIPSSFIERWMIEGIYENTLLTDDINKPFSINQSRKADASLVL